MSDAASRVLLIQELAECMVEFTFERPSPSAPPVQCSTLLSLARVNKALSEIALARLWLAFDTCEPLLSLLEPKLQVLLMPWKFAGKAPGKARLPRAKDLIRYVYYSQFVQSLDLIKEPQAMLRTLERADYLVVEFGLNERHYPNLKVLDVRLERLFDWARYFTLRTGPTTQGLFFTLDPVIPNLRALKHLGKRWTNITSFKLATANLVSRETFLEILRPILVKMHSLEAFKVHVEAGIVGSLLRALRDLPKLNDIYLAISQGAIVEPKLDIQLEPRSSSGNELMLQCETPDPSYFPSIMKISADFSISYTTIKLVSDPNANEQMVAESISSIVKYQPEARFINFLDRAKPRVERQANVVFVNPDTFPLSSPTILPLTQLANLTDIDIDTCGPVMVTPELLDALASAAPLLYTCHLSPYRLPRSNQHMKANEFLITLQDVLDFVGRCTRIWDAGIAFDARKPNGATNEDIPTTSRSALAHLHIGGSLIDDAEYVGLRLVSLPEMGMAVMMPPDYLVATFLPTPQEQRLWYQVNKGHLVDKECGCGKQHEEYPLPPENVQHAYHILSQE